MSSLPISSKYRSTPDRLVDEAERAELNRRLNEAFGRGEVSQEEYSQLMDVLYAAVRLGDLVPVAEKATIRAEAQVPAIVQSSSSAQPGQLSETNGGLRLARWTIGGSIALALVVVLLLVTLL